MIRVNEADDLDLLGDWEVTDVRALEKALNAQWPEGWQGALQLYYLENPAALVQDFPKLFRRVDGNPH